VLTEYQVVNTTVMMDNLVVKVDECLLLNWDLMYCLHQLEQRKLCNIRSSGVSAILK